MENSLVSIILPVYNGSRFLKQSIDSVLSQTYTNFELIIVDDFSTDETPSIIKEYIKKDNRIRSIRHSKNMYLPQALNTGFEIAKGEYFTWTSDDNIYKPNAIECLVKILLQNNNIDIVYGNETGIDDNGNFVQGYKMDIPEVIPIMSCIGGYFMFRRNVYFEVGGYEKEWFLVEDWQFWLKSYNLGFKFLKIDDNNYLYRYSSVALTSTRKVDINIKAIELSMTNLLVSREKYSKQIIMRAYLKNIRRCWIINNKEKAYENLRLAKLVDSEAIKYLNVELVKWLEVKG